MQIHKCTAPAFVVIFLIITQSSFCKTAGSTEWHSNPESRIKETLNKRSSSISLPNWTDTALGMVSGVCIFALQQYYAPEFAAKAQEFLFANSQHKEWIKNGFLLVPALLFGGWVFFELRQYTSSGLYDRATTVLSHLNFKCSEREFGSIYEFFQYLAHHGDAKELRIINDEFNYVMTHKFLSKILLELTYALRLLERSSQWSFDSSVQAQIDALMYSIRSKIRYTTHNKMMFENDSHYRVQLAQYEQQQHLSNEGRVTEAVVGQHALEKVKFVVKTIGKIIGFIFGSRRNNH